MYVPKEKIDNGQFEDWAFNWLVNELENGNLKAGFVEEQEDGSSLNVVAVGDSLSVTVRAYIVERGWMSITFNYKPQCESKL